MMVAKLSNRCFRLVLQIPESLNLHVTQSDFLDLYGKSEEKQCELLRAVLEGTISFQDLKWRRVSFSGSTFFAQLPHFLYSKCSAQFEVINLYRFRFMYSVRSRRLHRKCRAPEITTKGRVLISLTNKNYIVKCVLYIYCFFSKKKIHLRAIKNKIILILIFAQHEEEIARLKSQNIDLRIKLQQVRELPFSALCLTKTVSLL